MCETGERKGWTRITEDAIKKFDVMLVGNKGEQARCNKDEMTEGKRWKIKIAQVLER